VKRPELVGDDACAPDLETAPGPLVVAAGFEIAERFAAVGDRQREAGREAASAQLVDGEGVGVRVAGQQLGRVEVLICGGDELDLVGVQLVGEWA
jgi:hypothetical protein